MSNSPPSSLDKLKQQQQQKTDDWVEHKKDECNVKGTMTATDLASTSVPDISALELPASMHTESSEFTAEKVSDIPDNKKDQEIKQESSVASAAAVTTPIGTVTSTTTEMDTVDSNNNYNNTTIPTSFTNGTTTTAIPSGSILQAKFLSSIQRQNQQETTILSPNPEQQSLMSMSTPQIPTATNASITISPNNNNNRRQRSPSSSISPQPLKHHHHDNNNTNDKENNNNSINRNGRRKALSLLVNSVTDHLQHDTSATRLQNNKKSTTMNFTRTNNKHGTRERAQSVLTSSGNNQRYSGLKRVVVVGKDRATTASSTASDAISRSSMHVMPSVSEQTVIHDKDKHKSAGKKLMEWFKKKPLSTRHGPHYPTGDMMFTDRPLSSLQRAMPLGKSYAVDFNDSKLRTHHGAVDQEALTSGSPVDVLVEVKQALLSMGIDVKKDGEYKLKCIRQRRKRPSSQESTTTSSSSSNSRTDKKRRMSTSTPFRKLLRRSGVNQTTTMLPGTSPASSSTTTTTTAAAAVAVDEMAMTASASTTGLQIGETVYGDPVVDPGEEVRFSVELCKIKNLPGLYIVDIRRMRGNVWAYKFLYHTLLDTLNLSGKGGYIKTPTQQQQQQPRAVEHQNNGTNGGITESTPSSSSSSSSRKNINRHSCASSGGSSSMLEDVKEEE
ncbi:hypothetical protein INT45_009997 [Circinella minor]|uniref:non-specific serine/threonine protein kinase n=1 Tax=Circinella minor TaxID=1195481 RepID=A0A8H7S7S7_9FUNG|nr:hypothetical protein INT45_009997 [Circinella minor]